MSKLRIQMNLFIAPRKRREPALVLLAARCSVLGLETRIRRACAPELAAQVFAPEVRDYICAPCHTGGDVYLVRRFIPARSTTNVGYLERE